MTGLGAASRTAELGAADRTCSLEVLGELEPVISPLTEPVERAGTGMVLVPTEPHLFEYQWTLEYPELPDREDESPEAVRSFWPPFRRDRGAPRRSPEAATRVRLMFALQPGWRASEIMATVKHLSPVQEEETWREKVAEDWNSLAPMLGAAGDAAATVVGQPEIGSVARAMARLKVTSVPQTPATHWFVERFHEHTEAAHYWGTEWHLPATLLRAVGTRITGSLLVAFLAYHGGDPLDDAEVTDSDTLLAEAAVVSGPEEVGRARVGLRVRPHPADPAVSTG
jgi:hypothetical protein